MSSINYFHSYGIIIAFGVLAGFLLARKRSELYQISQQEIENVYLLLIPTCIFGARLYHLFHQWKYYSQNPKQIIAIWQGGLGIYGAIIIGLIALRVYTKIKKLCFLNLLDLLFPAVALTQAIGRWANFFNREAFGPPTNLPWKIYIPFENRPFSWREYAYFHPLFLYESLFMFLSFFLLLSLSNKFPKKRGLITDAYLVLYGSIRFLTEFGRLDTWQINGVKVAQVLSLLSISAGIFLLAKPKHLN